MEIRQGQPIQKEYSKEVPKLPTASRLPLIIFAVIIVALLLGGSFYLGLNKAKQSISPAAQTQSEPTSIPTPAPDPTANWETYINKENGFLFKYPPVGATINDNTLNINDQLYFVVSEFSTSDCEGICPQILKTESVSINGNNFVKFTAIQPEDMAWPSDAGPQEVFYEIDLSNNLKGIFSVGSLYSESQDYLNNLNTLNQILSTFQFNK